jgi:hypothetical protein
MVLSSIKVSRGNLMKRCIVVIMVMALLVPTMFAAAQGDDDGLTETFTSDDGRLTFNYPEGWFVNVDEEGDISVSTGEDIDRDISDVIPSGQVSVSFGVGSPEDFEDDGFALPVNASAEFMAGFYTGFYSVAMLFASAFDEAPPAMMTIGTAEMLDINEELAALVQIDIEDTQTILIITMPSTETSVRILIVASAYGEMDDYQDIAIAMMESVEFTP